MAVIFFIIMLTPYYGLALIPYFIQRRNKGRNLSYNILTYLLCIAGISLAYIHNFGFYLPESDFDLEEKMFFLMILPFVIVLILTAKKDYTHRKSLQEESDF